MTIGINCGHTASGAGYGAVGLIKESEHTRLVGHALMDLFKAAGITVIDCTIDQANTQNEYLAAAVALANRQDLDWFISIHFNASSSHVGRGVEVYTYEGRQYQDALDVCNNIAALGFTNRGVKAGTGLYVIRKTKAKTMLIEVCFCDNQQDISLYMAAGGAQGIAKAICNAVLPYVKEENPAYQVLQDQTEVPCGGIDSSRENHSMTKDEFIEFVGNVAGRDWSERHLVLPSIVVAQAIKESAWGTSELAQNANALFGIKQNGWTGKVYYKDATEQNQDGTYRKDTSVAWRAYDSWEQSIIDHNDYIATRKVGNQAEPNFSEVIGETDLKKAIAGLVGNEVRKQSAEQCTDMELRCCVLEGKTQFPYATSHTYPQSIQTDYIEKYNLTRYDEAVLVQPEETVWDETAPEGMLFVVQVGAYKSLNNAKTFKGQLEKMGIISQIKLRNVDKVPE